MEAQTDRHPPAADDAARVALACQALGRRGEPVTVRAVQKELRETFGSGLRWDRLGPLISNWESDGAPAPGTRKPSRKAAPPAVSFEEVVARHPDLAVTFDLLAGGLADLLDRRDRTAADDRRRAVEATRAETQQQADEAVAAATAARDAELAARDEALAAHRAAEAAVGEEIDGLERRLCEQAETQARLHDELEALRKQLAARDQAHRDSEAAREAAEAALATVSAERDTLRKDAQAAQVRAESAQAEAAAGKRLEDRLSDLLRARDLEFQELQKRNDHLSERLERLTTELRDYKQANERLRRGGPTVSAQGRAQQPPELKDSSGRTEREMQKKDRRTHK